MCAASAASQSSPASTAAANARSKSGSAASLSPDERRSRPRSRSTRMRTRGSSSVDLVEQPVAAVVVLAQALHARELRQRLRPQRAEARLGRVEVVEVPEWSQRVAHRPVVEKC